MFHGLTGVFLWPPQRATLDSFQTLLWFVSYRRLAPEFQHSLSAVTLGIYLSGLAVQKCLVWQGRREREAKTIPGIPTRIQSNNKKTRNGNFGYLSADSSLPNQRELKILEKWPVREYVHAALCQLSREWDNTASQLLLGQSVQYSKSFKTSTFDGLS